MNGGADQIERDKSAKYAEIDRGPTAQELEDAYAAARLWRFDERAV